MRHISTKLMAAMGAVFVLSAIGTSSAIADPCACGHREIHGRKVYSEETSGEYRTRGQERRMARREMRREGRNGDSQDNYSNQGYYGNQGYGNNQCGCCEQNNGLFGWGILGIL